MQAYHTYSNMPDLNEHKVIAEIDVAALAENYRALDGISDTARSICVVKADAYGHVADICVRALIAEGCDFFAVSCIEEAISVRKICSEESSDADILILGYTDCRQASVLAEYNIIQSVISRSYALELDEMARIRGCRVRVHIALDTGMNRIGICACSDIQCREATDTVCHIAKLKGLCTEGMFTHFARSDEDTLCGLSENSLTERQCNRFTLVRDGLRARGVDLLCHVCNSAAAINLPQYAFDAVRLGIALYGIQPSSRYFSGIRPVMSLKTVVAHTHRLLPGESVGYGGQYSADGERVIATLPIGYADGFLRAYSGCFVTVHTKSGDFKAQTVGRICMDQCMIDVTDIPTDVGDTVTVFGGSPDELRALAKLASTIEYECVCLISQRVPRIKK